MRKGLVGLIFALALVIGFVIWQPVARWFLAISAGVGIVVAGVLYLWRTLRPITEEDIDNEKHPLKLE